MKLNQVALQLYTCRDLLKTPAEIAKTFNRLRSIGYTAVELYGLRSVISEEDLAKLLKEEGLIAISTHGINLDDPSQTVEQLHTLGCTIAAYPYPGGVDFASRESVDGLIAKLQRAGEVMHKAGQTLCYHNHNHEFRKLDGKVILERIYDETTSDALQGELDTYWVQYGGGNVMDWCEKLAGRLPLIHLKDYRTNELNAPEFCEIGNGNLNFKQIISSAEKAGCKWFIVEQDICPGDPVDSLAQSFRYIEEHLVD